MARYRGRATDFPIGVRPRNTGRGTAPPNTETRQYRQPGGIAGNQVGERKLGGRPYAETRFFYRDSDHPGRPPDTGHRDPVAGHRLGAPRTK